MRATTFRKLDGSSVFLIIDITAGANNADALTIAVATTTITADIVTVTTADAVGYVK